MKIKATTTTSHGIEEHADCKFQAWVQCRVRTGTTKEIIDAFREEAAASTTVVLTRHGELVATSHPLYTAGDKTVTKIEVEGEIIFDTTRK
jgi:hypothetical protein